MVHCMVDLETMSTAPNAAIVSIGAVAFDSNGIKSTYYAPVDIVSSMSHGLHVDGDTILWWLKQTDQARAELWAQGRAALPEACEKFARFYVANACETVWGNGATFDNVILTSAFTACELDRPWKYNADRCFRTIKAAFPKEDVPTQGTAHKAVDDAVWQAEYLIKLNDRQAMRSDRSIL